ncbi:TrkH family potassium uptake protein [Haloglomus salinum]|uniref:TrkH family potassium uptake protein n=1 Tax=Haloglomus salinum TaxID=2962673 RepID=UPI0020C97FBA|nr:TrkH family potassium uptake protein [Haloglomus salinum]
MLLLGVTDGGRGSLRVDWRASLSLVGTVLKYLAVPLMVPLLVGVVYGDDVFVFLLTALFTLLVGTGLERLDPDPDLGAREGFLMVAGAWLGVALVAAVPYLLAARGVPGILPPSSPASTLANPVNALFESMSGFTTTGATLLGEISLDRHSHAILIWRQLTQWLGGMGIIVLAIAILPELSVGGAQLMDAEAPGVGIEKLTPRIAETARVLWIAYFAFTALEIGLLYGLHLAGPLLGMELAPNMGAYNAVAHGLTTLPTGGFSPEADSIAAFSAAVQWVVIPFMVVAGTNFALFYAVFRGDIRKLVDDAEFRAYAGIMGVLSAILAGVLFVGGAPPLGDLGGVVQGNVENTLRQSIFQVVSLVTTTGYATSDFAQWSEAGKYLLLFAMFIGGSGGSTGGAIKIVRWVVIVKVVRRELFTTTHPEAVQPIRLAGEVVDEDAVRGVMSFTLLYLLLFAVGTVLISLDVSRVGYDINTLEAMSAIAATLGNVGPGFGSLGPFGSYLEFPATSKLLMVFLMWIGRLEILPVLVLLTSGYWKS